MGYIIIVVMLICTFSLSAKADVRLKVRSTPFFDVRISLDDTKKEFSSPEVSREEILSLPTKQNQEEMFFQICYAAKKQKGVPNAKNVGYVHFDYFGKSQKPQRLRSISPDGATYSPGVETCEMYSLKVKNALGVEEFEIITLQEQEPTLVPQETKVAESPAVVEVPVEEKKDVLIAEVNEKVEKSTELPRETAAIVESSVENIEAPPSVPEKMESNPLPPVSAQNMLFASLELIVLLLSLIICIASIGIIFRAGGEPFWAVIVPVYGFVCYTRLGNKPWWFVLLMFIPLVNVAAIIMINIGIAERFQKSALYGLGLTLLQPIFLPLLAFQVRGTSNKINYYEDPNATQLAA